jgi:cytochrome c biogenesis protein CcdA/thiol-disulfide isomerase/thioredoxin
MVTLLAGSHVRATPTWLMPHLRSGKEENRVVELIAIGFVAGIVAGISPCILPVLPIILVAGATTPDNAREEAAVSGVESTGWVHPTALSTATVGGVATLRAPGPDATRTPAPKRSLWRTQARPVSVVAGLVVSFSLLILAGSEVLSAVGLPQGLLHDAGIVVLVAVGLGLLFPRLSALLERPFARISARRQPDGTAGGFVVGLALGLLFVPCAGPILAAITVAGATHKVGWTAVFLTIAFALGAAIPLLLVAVAGSELAQRTKSLRRHAPRVRQIGGVVVLVMALAIGLNTFSNLQRDVPGYTSTLQNKIEGGTKVRKQLSALSGNVTKHNAALTRCNPDASILINCGTAPNFAGITAWFHTPGGKPLTMAQLRGKVVLVDFWTYSCINCQRTLPHVESWYRDYAKDGFVVVGVHTPEFSFEHVVSNVRTEAAALGVKYPVAVDDNYKTWDAYDNEYWPAEYLIDAQGQVRHVSFGEGGYSDTERLIRQLLTAAHPGIDLPAATDVPDKTPTGEENPETYVGYQKLQYLMPEDETSHDEPAVYQFPSSLQLGGLAWSGTWTDHAEEATAGGNARMELAFLADDIYLVIGGSGTVDVSIDGKHTRTVNVGGVPKLYSLFHAAASTTGTLEFSASPGIQAYDFTFG